MRTQLKQYASADKESTMRILRLPVWRVTLLTCVASTFALADDTPKLPDQYAQVVLRVEGMI